MLSRDQAKPGCEIATSSELLGRRTEGLDCQRRLRTDAWHHLKSLRLRIGQCPVLYLHVEDADLDFDAFDLTHVAASKLSDWERNALENLPAEIQKGPRVLPRLCEDDAVFGKMCAQGIGELDTLRYWLYMRTNHPSFVMNKPSPKGSKSRWVKFKGPSFAPGVLFTHKINQRVMELGFAGSSIEELPEDMLSKLPSSARCAQLGKTAAIQIDVPAIDLDIDFSSQIENVELAIGAAYQLFPCAERILGVR